MRINTINTSREMNDSVVGIETEVNDDDILVDDRTVAVAGNVTKSEHGIDPLLASGKIRLEVQTVSSVVFQVVWLPVYLAWKHAAIAVSVGVLTIYEARAWSSLPERAQILACQGM